jgi:hypothetical protein
MDFNVWAFEPNHGRIQDCDCENVIGQPFNCLSKVKFWPFLWHSHIICLVLFIAIVGGTQCFDQIYLRKGCLCLWFCDNRKICRVDLFMMYFDPTIGYQHEHFQVFCDVVDNNFATIPKLGY